jgi:hypothetical protein
VVPMEMGAPHGEWGSAAYRSGSASHRGWTSANTKATPRFEVARRPPARASAP